MHYLGDLSSFLARFVWNTVRVLASLALVVPVMVVITGIAYVLVTLAAVFYAILLSFECLKQLGRPFKQNIFRTKAQRDFEAQIMEHCNVVD